MTFSARGLPDWGFPCGRAKLSRPGLLLAVTSQAAAAWRKLSMPVGGRLASLGAGGGGAWLAPPPRAGRLGAAALTSGSWRREPRSPPLCSGAAAVLHAHRGSLVPERRRSSPGLSSGLRPRRRSPRRPPPRWPCATEIPSQRMLEET